MSPDAGARAEDRDQPTAGLATQVPQRGAGPVGAPPREVVVEASVAPLTAASRGRRSRWLMPSPSSWSRSWKGSEQDSAGPWAPRNPGKGLMSTTTGRPPVMSRSTPYSCRPRAAPASPRRPGPVLGEVGRVQELVGALVDRLQGAAPPGRGQVRADHPHLDVEPVVGGELLGDDGFVAPLGQQLGELRRAAHQAHEVAAGAGAALDTRATAARLRPRPGRAGRGRTSWGGRDAGAVQGLGCGGTVQRRGGRGRRVHDQAAGALRGPGDLPASGTRDLSRTRPAAPAGRAPAVSRRKGLAS